MVEKEKEEKPKVDIFKHFYYELKDKLQTDKDVIDRDITQELDAFIKDKIDNKELINLSIRGEVGTGKSLLALELMRRINKYLEEKFDKKINNYEWIASDQNEFLRLTKTEENNVCVEIDEYNAMGKTGANATTEQAEYEFFSDVCRIQYIHKISCTPIRIVDSNAMVIIDILSNNKQKEKTMAIVRYRNLLEGQTISIGTINLDVSKTLKTKWYKKYEKKKLMRIKLMNTYGIRDIRELEFAEVALQTIKELKRIAEIGKVHQQLIRTKIQTVMKTKYKRPMSWFAEDEIIKPVSAVLSNMTEMRKAKQKEVKKEIQRITEEIIMDLKEKEEILKRYKQIN